MAAAGKAPRRNSAEAARIAVVDIGSNSIRLVVYDGLHRTFIPIFNEKVICGLGRGLSRNGKLSEEGVELACTNLWRFARVALAMGVSDMHLLATAAVREAANGAEFVSRVEKLCGHRVQILSGDEEARIAALGVVAGTPDADGLCGDLGGGSLELVEIGRGELGRSATLGLGPLRLIDLDDRESALKEVDRQLGNVAWLGEMEGRSLYAVGGAWRALARIQMEQAGYPLHVIHGFVLPRKRAEELVDLIAPLGKRSLSRIAGVPRRRLETLPYAAMVMSRLLRLCKPKELFFSSFGLREGFVFDRLPARQQAKDPLLKAAADYAKRVGRFGDLGKQLTAWTDTLFPNDVPSMRRIRQAACHLSDISWREHPDYRAGQAMLRVLHYPFGGIDHVGRAFLALVVYARYGGNIDAPEATPVLTMLPRELVDYARITGLALRLAYTLSGGTKAILESTKLEMIDKRLMLVLPSDDTVPLGEVVERRFNALVEATSAKRGEIATTLAPEVFRKAT